MTQQYRIHRGDSRNLAIQKRTGTNCWVNVSFHGNSINSLISGIHTLVVSNCIPEDDTLLKSLKSLELEYARGIEKVEEIVKNSEWGGEGKNK